MLDAYFDDSGGSDNGLVSIGGWVACRSNWQNLELAWGQALKEFEIPYVRMADLIHRSGPYKSWSEEKKQDAINRFTGLCSQHLDCMISSVISTFDFELIFSDERRSRVGSPLVTAAMSAFALVETLAEKEGYTGDVCYFLEKGCLAEGQIARAFELSFNAEKRSIQFVPKCEAGAQAADIAAYECRQSLDRTNVSIALRYPFQKLIRESKWAVKYVMRDELQDLHTACLPWPDLKDTPRRSKKRGAIQRIQRMKFL